MATQDINRLRQLFEGNKIGENRVQPPVFGAPTPPDPINTQQSYEDLFPTNDIKNVRMQNVLDPDSINYTPETADTAAYRKHIGEMPEYQDRGVWDKIIAGGLSLGNKQRGIPGGYKAGQDFLNAPHERDMEAWKAKTQPLGAAATLENARNVNARQMAGYELRDKQYQEGIASRERIASDRNAVNERKNEILESKNRGYTYTKLGNKLIGHAPDGRTFEAGSAADFSPLELERLRQTGRMALEGERHTGDMAEIGARTAGDIQVKQTEPAYDPNRASNQDDDAEDPAKIRMRRNNALRTLYDNPKYRDFIQPGESSTDDWTLTEPPKTGGWWGNATPEEIQSYVDLQKELEKEVIRTTPARRTRPSRPSTGGNTGGDVKIGDEVSPPASVTQPAGGTFKFNTPPQSGGGTKFQTPMRSMGKNQRTGETAPIVSYDGGKTWQPEGK